MPCIAHFTFLVHLADVKILSVAERYVTTCIGDTCRHNCHHVKDYSSPKNQIHPTIYVIQLITIVPLSSLGGTRAVFSFRMLTRTHMLMLRVAQKQIMNLDSDLIRRFHKAGVGRYVSKSRRLPGLSWLSSKKVRRRRFAGCSPHPIATPIILQALFNLEKTLLLQMSVSVAFLSSNSC